MRFGVSIVMLLLAAFYLAGCSGSGDDPVNSNIASIEDLDIPDDFNYETIQEVELVLEVQSALGEPAEGTRIFVFANETEESISEVIRGRTNAQGVFTTKIQVPGYVPEIAVVADRIDIDNLAVLEITGSTLEYTFEAYVPEEEPAKITGFEVSGQTRRMGSELDDFSFIEPIDGGDNPWNSKGKPNYLVTPDEIFEEDFLELLSESFPMWEAIEDMEEQFQMLRQNSPDNITNLRFLDDATVHVSYLTSGGRSLVPAPSWYKAGVGGQYAINTWSPHNRDAVGFYYADEADEDMDMHVIFPNVYGNRQNNNLQMGDRMLMGDFSAGDELGFWIGADAWNQDDHELDEDYAEHFYFSDDELNTDDLWDENDNQRILTLVDYENERLVVLFERDGYPYDDWDSDFADVMLSVTVDPWNAVDFSDMPTLMGEPADGDGDGVNDMIDEYPDNDNMCFNSWSPGSDTWGRLAFEDQWPVKGDYDFNDLVVAYRGNHITNNQNKVVQIELEFDVKAVGAAFRNGFAVELPFSPDLVESVTGNEAFVTNGSVFSIDGNGTESNQTYAVIPIFDESSLVTNTPVGEFVNTEPGSSTVNPETIQITIALNSPYFDPATYDDEESGIPFAPPYNPFLVRNRDRKVEIHLPGYHPTDEMDMGLFNTGDDNSDEGNERYYKSINNLPWALLLPNDWDHVVELVELPQAYIHFVEWAESGGELYEDWYVDQSGYVVEENIWTETE